MKVNIMGSEVEEGYECKPKILDKNKPMMKYKDIIYICCDKRCISVSYKERVKELRDIIKELNLEKGQNRIKISRSFCQGACRFKQVMHIASKDIWLKQTHTLSKEELKNLFISLANNNIDNLKLNKIDFKVY